MIEKKTDLIKYQLIITNYLITNVDQLLPGKIHIFRSNNSHNVEAWPRRWASTFGSRVTTTASAGEEPTQMFMASKTIEQ